MGQYFFADDGSPLARAEDVIPFLGKAIHWRAGRSAYEAAYSWFDAQDVPASIRAVLETDPAFSGAKLARAVFEKKTALNTLGRPSQTDVLALLDAASGPLVLGIEAKVDESFGPLVAEWNDGSRGKALRLAGLVDHLSLNADAVGTLRYQLLHRTVATLIEAERAGANDAALIVQSFSPAAIRAGFADFQSFTAALGAPVKQPGSLSPAIQRGGVKVRFGWAQDSVRVRAAAQTLT